MSKKEKLSKSLLIAFLALPVVISIACCIAFDTDRKPRSAQKTKDICICKGSYRYDKCYYEGYNGFRVGELVRHKLTLNDFIVVGPDPKWDHKLFYIRDREGQVHWHLLPQEFERIEKSGCVK